MFMWVSHEVMFTSQNENSGIKLSFSSLYPYKTLITRRRASTLFQTDVSILRAFLNETTLNGGLKNFMYAITEV